MLCHGKLLKVLKAYCYLPWKDEITNKEFHNLLAHHMKQLAIWSALQ